MKQINKKKMSVLNIHLIKQVLKQLFLVVYKRMYNYYSGNFYFFFKFLNSHARDPF